MNEAQRLGSKRATDWESDAIAKCYQDPELVALENSGDLCIPCMMNHPCLCDMDKTLVKMREFYEANRRTMFRKEPVLNLNWGQKGDGLMDGLFRIAREPYIAEIKRLRARIKD